MTRRLTMTEYLALRYLADRGESYGLTISQATEIKSGSLYPVLARLEEQALVASRWEDADPSEEHRPRRRYYQLTGAGRGAVTDMAVRLREGAS